MNTITPTAATDTPYTLTIDTSAGVWRYALTNPDGTTTRNAIGPLGGVDADVLNLYALATALQEIPKGVALHIRSTSNTVVQMGQRLTKPSDVPELPFLPFTPDRRTAWSYVLPLLEAYAVTWQCVARNDMAVITLGNWAAAAQG
ncbi:MAG: hypothetical protein P4K83_12445 [Terracidiphilus sp.]|nr:hypothetical protein [Terracidiphilus sp.]